MPYTLPQDHLLFVILKEKDINIWKNKLDWIAERGGMALLNTHADYINFGDGKLSGEEYPVSFYSDFLSYIKDSYSGRYWNALPSDVVHFWKTSILPTVKE